MERLTLARFSRLLRGPERTNPEELLHAARVLLWVRWFGLTAAFVEIHYRVDYGSLSHVLNTFYCLGFLAANGYVQWLIRRRGTVKPSWLFALSALDLAAIYSALSFAVEPGLDLAGKEEQHLFYRLVALYAVSAAVSIIAGLERESRRRGLERERELQRQRIELSQTIHDTTAQWAYMIGLGVEGAMELADETQ